MEHLDALDVAACRRQFPGLGRQVGGRPAVFFDGPGGSQVPRRVIDAVADCLAHHNANEGGLFATSREAGEIVAAAHKAVADLLGSDDPDLVVFGPNMTSLTFALGRSLARVWSPGDEVVVTRLDHDANVTPWVLAAKEAGAVVQFLDVDPAECSLRLDRLKGLLSPQTRLVALGVASNAVGTINPVAEIAAAAHRVGALVFLDAVHAVPHLLADVRRWGADFLVCSAYKFFGPHLGVLWGRRELLERLPAYKIRPAPETLPGRWMTGTPSFEAIAGTGAAVDYLADLGRQVAPIAPAGRREALAAAFAAIRRHESTLTARLLAGLARRPSWHVWGVVAEDRLGGRVPTFGLTHERHTPRQLAKALAERGIFVWSGDFYALGLVEALGLAPEGMLRIGLLHYNTAEEVDRFLASLDELDRLPTGGA
jgi:cysteine desulfurase family protein (TIGR01976 family)